MLDYMRVINFLLPLLLLILLLIIFIPLGVKLPRVKSKKVKIKAGVTNGPERHRS